MINVNQIEKELFLAIDANNFAEVQRIIRTYQVDLNYIDPEHGSGSPLLTYALTHGCVRIARELIMAGADVNLGNDGSDRYKYMSLTPLNCAISCEFNSRYFVDEDRQAIDGLVNLLLDKGANPNAVAHTGASPLSQLFYWWDDNLVENIEYIRLRVLESLISNGATETSLGNNKELKNKFREELNALLIKSNTDLNKESNEYIENKIRKAIRNKDFIQIVLLLPHLQNGINTRMEYGCTPLIYAIDKNLPDVVDFLIARGAKIEQHENNYTPLNTAIEAGNLKIVETLLKYGASLAGEFTFNLEDSISVAAFKFCHSLMLFVEKLSNKLKSLIAKNRAFKEQDDILQYWEMLSRHERPTWLLFGGCENLYRDFTQSCIYLYDAYNVTVFPYLDNLQRKDFEDIQVRANIYNLIINKLDILLEEAPTYNLDKEASEEEEELYYKLHSINHISNKEAILTREEVQEHIDRLNKELTTKTEEEIDWEEYPNFYIAQYRGLHYYRNSFSKNKRADHRKTFHLNRIAPAPAVYYMSSLTPDQHQLARESTIEANKEIVVKTFKDLKDSKEIKQYWGNEKRKFKNASDMLQQRMSSDYAGYKKDIIEHKTSVPKLLYDKKIIGYPHYATSDLPFHALKYAYGQKRIEGLSEWRLRPMFQENGKRLHPYPGKIFISLYTPLQLYQYDDRKVAGMRKRKSIHLPSTVLPERETSIPGGVDADSPFYEELLEIPAFETYNKDYYTKYGIDAEQFKKFKTDIMQSCRDEDVTLRKKVKNDLIEKTLIIHKEKQLLRMVQSEAMARGGYLIYKHFDGKYGLEPEALPLPRNEKNSVLYERERALFGLVEAERFTKNTCSEIQAVNIIEEKTESITTLFQTKKRSNSSTENLNEHINKRRKTIDLKECAKDIFKKLKKHQLKEATFLSIQTSIMKETKNSLHSMADAYGFSCHDVNANGLCLFLAIEHQLLLLHQNDNNLPQYSCKALLDLFIDHIFNNMNSYKESIVSDINKFANGVLDYQQNWTTEIGDIASLVLSRALNMTIVIISDNGNNPIIHKRHNSIATIFVGYEKGIHYQSLIRVQKANNIDQLVDSAPVDDWNAKEKIEIGGAKIY